MKAASSAVLFGLALTVLAVLAVGIGGTATAPAAPAAARVDTQLVVATHLPAPGLRAGALRGNEIVAAAGLEIDVARALARRLGRTLRLVHVADARALTRAGATRWDVAIGGITPTMPGTAKRSVPYLRADAVVLMRPGLTRPRGRADLRSRVLCGVSGDPSAIALRALPSRFPTLTASSDAALVRLVASGRCDAAVGEAPRLGTAVERLGGRHGHVGGRLAVGAPWVLAVPRGSGVVASEVNGALRRLRADGTLGRIAERWLGFDPARLRALR
jgi:polar amino acid transport system substrate-binding protein